MHKTEHNGAQRFDLCTVPLHRVDHRHDRKMQYAAMKELSCLKDFKYMINYVLNSALKKLVSPSLWGRWVALLVWGPGDLRCPG